MKVLSVTPRTPLSADKRINSIELSARDLILSSRYKDTTTIIGDFEEKYAGINFRERPRARRDTFRLEKGLLLDQVRMCYPDVIVVHEHLRTAAWLADQTGLPVFLHKHNPIKPPGNLFDRISRTRQHNLLRGIFFVSEYQKYCFKSAWRGVTPPLAVIPNGLNLADWKPETTREKSILVVGRAVPEKGILEAAKGVASSLKNNNNWSANFILSEVEAKPEYFNAVRKILAPLNGQVSIFVQKPHSFVKELMQRASIVIASSLVDETFGRVALEAHAGGATLISSGRGGLREVSGQHALYLEHVNHEAIEGTIRSLIKFPHLLEKFSISGRKHVEQSFDLASVARGYDDLIKAS